MAFEKLEKEKQNKIINSACEVFAKHGYRKASMKDIADAAGISKSVLFKYFSTKENLYSRIFRLASDSIGEADDIARREAGENADVFSLMRRSAKARLSLFKEYPWIYRFAYTAAFDTDLFVRDLVKNEMENYRRLNTVHDRAFDNKINEIEDSKVLRKDLSPETARRIILWISQGYLEDKLFKDKIYPDSLELGFEKWIDVLELLLKDKQKL